MTKEELIKQKAEAEADKVIIGSGMDRASVIHLKHLLTTLYIQGYHAGAEPREKRIAELTEQNTSLLTSVENLNKSVQELEAQIGKMKNCYNCEEFSNGCSILPSQRTSFSCDKWELAE